MPLLYVILCVAYYATHHDSMKTTCKQNKNLIININMSSNLACLHERYMLLCMQISSQNVPSLSATYWAFCLFLISYYPKN